MISEFIVSTGIIQPGESESIMHVQAPDGRLYDRWYIDSEIDGDITGININGNPIMRSDEGYGIYGVEFTKGKSETRQFCIPLETGTAIGFPYCSGLSAEIRNTSAEPGSVRLVFLEKEPGRAPGRE